jgi:hypothetical protein
MSPWNYFISFFSAAIGGATVIGYIQRRGATDITRLGLWIKGKLVKWINRSGILIKLKGMPSKVMEFRKPKVLSVDDKLKLAFENDRRIPAWKSRQINFGNRLPSKSLRYIVR